MHKNIIIPLLCQCGLFTNTYLSKNSTVSKDLIFYLLWHNTIRWSCHIYKKSSFFSFCNFLVKFNEYHMGGDRVELTKCDKVAKGEAIMKVTYVLNDPMFNLLFHGYIIFYTVRKWLLTINLARITLIVQLVCKISVL